MKKLKSHLSGQQSFFTQQTSNAKAAIKVSFRVSHVIVKNKKFFLNGEMVKEAFNEAADSMFRVFKNKAETSFSIKLCSCQEVQLHGAVKPWLKI